MREEEGEPEADLDDLDKAAHINFRDYPSSAMVVIAALISGVGWLLYKRRGRKSGAQAQHPASDGGAEPRDSARHAKPSTDRGA